MSLMLPFFFFFSFFIFFYVVYSILFSLRYNKTIANSDWSINLFYYNNYLCIIVQYIIIHYTNE